MIINQPIYDGALIKERFAYRFLRKQVNPSGDIVCFRAPMIVNTNLIDLEDSLTNDYIFSEDSINFCWEIPGLDPFGAVAFQRLFNTKISAILNVYINKPIIVYGDDIMVVDSERYPEQTGKQGKASVSITYSKNNVTVGHTGINIKAGSKAPHFAYSTELNENDINSFMLDVQSEFYNLVKDIFIATTKVIV